LAARTLLEFKVKAFPVKDPVTKGLGFPEKEPDPVIELAVKDPTERATDPAEAKVLAANLTLVKDQEAVEVRVYAPVPLIGIPETVNRPEEMNAPLMLTIGE